MTRRKQNTPKRLKSGEEGSEQAAEESGGSSCESEEEGSEDDGESSMETQPRPSDTHPMVEEETSSKGHKETAEDTRSHGQKIDETSIQDKNTEVVKGEAEKNADAAENSAEKMEVKNNEKDCIEHDTFNKEVEEKPEEKVVLKETFEDVDSGSSKCKEEDSGSKKEDEENMTEIIKETFERNRKKESQNTEYMYEKMLEKPPLKKPKLARDDVSDSVPLPKCVKDKPKSSNSRRPSGTVTPPPKHSETPMGMDSESPISKLLSMVNNPEKIQRKHSSYSHSFNLPACSLKSSSATSPKLSVSRAFPSTTNTSQSRSSKPLSGFLPPYNMFPSQLQGMYGNCNKTTAQSKDESRQDAKIQPLPMKASQSPKKDHKSSPVPSPAPKDQEQPLDLSVKSKGLDLSIKSGGIDLGQHERSASIPNNKHIPQNGRESSSSSMESSSLRSLEEKFGGNAFRTDKPSQRSPKSYLPYMHPMLSMYGGALYTPALFSTHPWMHTEKLPRSDIPQRKPGAGSSTTASPSKSTSQRSNSTEREYSSPQQKHLPTDVVKPDIDNFYDKKYTNLKCSCKKEFETLYELTVHLKQSGHTPSSRIPGQQEFPKLVRGQDMWLNHGSEQTKQILRCIRCGESFKTLPELTIHMMKTKHYANIVGGSESTRKLHKYPTDDLDIYKCYQCEESFHGTEEISKHMLSSGHHKSPIVIQPVSPLLSSPNSDRISKSLSRECSPTRHRSVSESSNSGRLPIGPSTKVNEIKEYDRDDSSVDSFSCEDSKIRCETCGDKIEMSKFVAHVRKCIRTGIWDYGTPLKKRRLDNIDNNSNKTSHSSDHFDLKRKYSENSGSSSAKLLNGRSSPQSPSLKEKTSKDAPIAPHSNSSCDGSALRAMESFIEKSFTPRANVDKGHMFGFGHMGSNRGFGMPHLNGHVESLKPDGGSDGSSTGSSNLYSKYLPPLYLNKVEKKEEQNDKLKSESETSLKEERVQTPPKTQSSPQKETQDKPVAEDVKEERKTTRTKSPDITTTENNNKPEIKKCCNETPPKIKESCQVERQDLEENNERKSLTPSPHSFKDKYLNIPEEGPEPPVQIKAEVPSQPLSSTSALESLQGLVYGKSFDTEHPLDSLQKLIHTADKAVPEKQNGSVDLSVVKNSPTMVKGLFSASSLIPSPFLAAFPTCNLSGPNSPCKSESSVSPAPESHSSDRRTPESSENEARTPSEGELDRSDSQGEFSCEACSRTFASVGAYRYHSSRCHLSKAKNYQYKENLKKTPYVYLPLDHSAKFNKYYEMANELASKTK